MADEQLGHQSKDPVTAGNDVRYGLDSKRSIKISEKGLTYQMDQLQRKLKSLKRLEKYLTEIALEDDEPLEVVRKKYCMWMEEYERFLDLYAILSPQVETGKQEEFITWFEESNHHLREFKSWIDSYITQKCNKTMNYELRDQQTSNEVTPLAEEFKASSKHSEHTVKEACNLDDKHTVKEVCNLDNKQTLKKDYDCNDNLSVTSTLSSVSVGSSASSYATKKRIKEVQRRVELEARKSALIKKREIEMSKLALKLQEEELELDTNIAVSQARSEVLDKYGSCEELTGPVSPCSRRLVEEHRVTSPKPLKSLYPSKFSDEHTALTPRQVIKEHLRQSDDILENKLISTLPTGNHVDSSKIAMQSVVQHLRKPVPEIKKFSGDPLEYRKFIRQFQVVANTDDDDEKMNYLEQLTQGEAHKVVSGFSHLRGERAYVAAMVQLEDRYGDDEVIATAFVKKALEWPSVRAGDAKALDGFALFLVECENAVSTESSGVLEYSENIKQVMLKLPFHLHNKWRNHVYKVKEAKRRVKFKDFVNFVKAEAKKVNDPIYGNVASTQKSKNPKVSNAVSEVKTDTDTKIVVKGLSKQEIYQQVKEKGLCFGCLKKCRNRLTCSVCGKSHPSILHDDSKNPMTNTNRSQNYDKACDKKREIPSVSTGYTLLADDQTGASDTSCSMAIIPVRVKLRNKPHSIVTYAFLDTGSSASFCTETVMRQLGATGKRTKLTLSTMGEPYTMTAYTVSGLQVCDVDMKNVIELPKVFTKEKMPVNRDHIPTQAEVSKWEHLSELSLAEPNVEIGLMLGGNVPDAYTPIKILTGPSKSPHATKTKLGWVVWNVLRNSDGVDVNRVHIQNETGESIEDMVKRSMNLDFPERLIDDKRENSREDRNFLKQVEQSIHQDGGHYCVSLPLRDRDIVLPDNSAVARKRLRGIQNKFKTDPNFKEDYIKFMKTLLEKGYAEPAPQIFEKGKVWYIPHHGVYHKKKNKIRVVFDCSAPYQGVSLNNNLLQGPDLTNNLLGVLLRFREEKVAVLGDIEAMFHQVKVPENERDYLRFYWWENGDIDSEPASYRMTVHLFGATSSPSVCNFALQRTVEDNQEHFEQKVQNTVRKNMYVDDCLTSVSTDKKAIHLVHDVTQMCKNGGLRITKWMSNSPDVIESIPEEDRAKDVKLWSLDSEPPIERALGVYWFVENDSLGFQIQVKDKPVNRRGILSVISSVYDPLGIASPFVLKAKSILQRLCKDGKDWDEEITGKDLKDWMDWLTQLPQLEDVVIDRCYKPNNFGEVTSCQLHGFADASDVGFGMVFYLRLVDQLGQIHCSFVLGKARVAPLKTVTIPRMELTAAATLVKLCKMLMDQLNYTMSSVFYWTDSTSVLHYIQNKNLRFHTFVANRLALIHEATEEDQWNYVNTKQNPADCASRGMNISKLTPDDIWFKGPEFLWKPESEWPVMERIFTAVESDPEVKKIVHTVPSVTEKTRCGIEMLLEHYSEWSKLKRAAGWLLTAKHNLRKAAEKTKQIRQSIRDSGTHEDPKKLEHKIGLAVTEERQHRAKGRSESLRTARLSVDVLGRAEDALISYVQHVHFTEEIEVLDKDGKLKRSSKLRKLDPFLKDNLLRVGGRLERAELPYDTKHPLVLPKESVISKLLLEDAHRSCGHLGKNTVLAFIRQKYWIIGARSYLKTLLSKCVTCRKYRAPCGKQKMANLPVERLVADEPPFSRIGMDYFGPFELKRGRSVLSCDVCGSLRDCCLTYHRFLYQRYPKIHCAQREACLYQI